MAPNISSQTTSARTKVGKQSHVTKKVKGSRPNGGSFRRTPGPQPVTMQTPEATGRPTPAASSPSSAAQPQGEFAGPSGLNRVNVTGRLGRDAVVRQTKNGRVVANFSVAVDESYKDQLGELHKKTAWHRVQVWEELAETVGSDLRQGVRVSVEGRRAIRHWIDRENREHSYTEIVASDVRFLDPAPEREARNGNESPRNPVLNPALPV